MSKPTVDVHTPQSTDTPAVILTTAHMVESASVAARFLDSLGILPYTLRITELGRVEAQIDTHLFDRARRILLLDGGTFHDDGDGFVYVEARIDGVPVQVWTAVES